MNVWGKQSQDTNHRCLSTIGETRWWAKHVVLKIFGSFSKPELALYVDVLATLNVLQNQASLKTQVHARAKG